jgi:hypothetical protein
MGVRVMEGMGEEGAVAPETRSSGRITATAIALSLEPETSLRCLLIWYWPKPGPKAPEPLPQQSKVL